MPFKNTLHIDKLLSNVSVKYSNSEYVADQIFPEVGVNNDTDKYRVYTRNLRIPETKRAEKGTANIHYFEVTTNSYILQDNALKDFVGDDEAVNYDMADLRADATEELTDALMRRREKDCADLFTTTNWSLNVSLTSTYAFNANTTLSNPIPIFLTGGLEILQNSGHLPNFAIIPHSTFIHITQHTSVLERFKYTSSEVSKAMISALFECGEIIKPTAVYDSSNRGITEAITDIWSDNCFLGFKPARPSPKVPSSGYRFEKNVPRVRRWREEERIADAIEVRMKYQFKVVASLTGFLIRDTLA